MLVRNLRQSKQKTCECKCCENFGCYEKGLACVLKVLSAEFGELKSDHEDSGNKDSDNEDDDVHVDAELIYRDPVMSHPGAAACCLCMHTHALTECSSLCVFQ